MKPRLPRVLILAGLAVLSAGSGAAGEPPPPTVDELFRYLGFEPKAKKDLLSGKVIAADFREGTDKELAITVAALFPVPLREVFEMARAGKNLEADRDVLAFRELKEPDAKDDFPSPLWGPSPGEELRYFLDAEPGSDLNLSTAEINAFRALRKKFPARRAERDPACVKALEDEARRFLQGRYRAYREGGLQAVATYDRGGGKTAKPGEELRAAFESAKLVGERFPAFYGSFLRYPREASKEVEHRFYWILEKVEDRPTHVLTHRAFYFRPDGALIGERQFYVGSAYNSLQIMIGFLPSGNNTLLFYTNRTSTDQVAGFASGLRHSIGRGRMRDKVVAHFEEIRERCRAEAKKKR